MDKNKTQQPNNKISELISTIIVILLAIIMYATKPTENQFKDFLKDNLKKEAYKDGEFSGSLMELFSGPTSWALSLSTNRKNYLFFSMYSISIFGEEYSYIGIFNNFIEI